VARKRYLIYRLTAPSGRAYVGVTGQAVQTRWRQHVRRAATGAKHPLCAAIRKYGAEAFSVETLSEHGDRDVALRAEIAAIAGLTNGYNLSPGGEHDGGAGAARFRELLADPEWRAAYVERLSAAIRSSERYAASREKIEALLVAWRAKNKEAVYRAAMRALRIGGSRRKPRPEVRIERARKGPAARFHKSNASRRAAKKQWAERAPEVKAEIGGRISESVAKMHAAKTLEQKAAHAAQLAKARQSIDHTIRKARQKEALEAYWTPERRAELSAKVRARRAAPHENV